MFSWNLENTIWKNLAFGWFLNPKSICRAWYRILATNCLEWGVRGHNLSKRGVRNTKIVMHHQDIFYFDPILSKFLLVYLESCTKSMQCTHEDFWQFLKNRGKSRVPRISTSIHQNPGTRDLYWLPIHGFFFKSCFWRTMMDNTFGKIEILHWK